MVTTPERAGDGRRQGFAASDLFAGVLASYAGLLVSLWWLLAYYVFELISTDVVYGVLVAAMYATPVWLVVMLFIGLPLAAWMERHTPDGAGVVRRFGPYLLAGAVLTAITHLVVPLATPIALVCTVAGRIGAGWWRTRRRRRETTAIRTGRPYTETIR